MPGARYVLLGLAPGRSHWFREVAQWANAGVVPAEFVKCLSAEEVRARLASGRPFSALLVDATVPALDRDLIQVARGAGCAVFVVGGGRRDWTEMGAASALPDVFDRRDLVAALTGHASLIGRADRATDESKTSLAAGWRAPVVAVTGPGGTGASTLAIALAQGFGSDVRSTGSVLLADLCLRAEQAMLHDARDVVPGVQELVDAFRSGNPTLDDVRALTFAVPERGYRLLLGLRRSRAWSTIRPQAFEAAFDILRSTHRVVVADVDADLEGEDGGGSIDVEERNVMARTACGSADAVVAVGLPGMKGLHALARVIGDLLAYGVPGGGVLAVVNRAPRGARVRSEVTDALAQLLPSWAPSAPDALFLPERHVDEALRDSVRLPDALTAPLVAACRRMVDQGQARRSQRVPQAIAPGTLGRWTPDLGVQQIR